MKRSHSHVYAALVLVGISGFAACGGDAVTFDEAASSSGSGAGGGEGGAGQGGEGQGGAGQGGGGKGGAGQGGAGQGGAGQGGAGQGGAGQGGGGQGGGGQGGAGQGGGGAGGSGGSGGDLPEPGENGAPCLSNQDCNGGYCISEPGGGYPSGYCIEICTLAGGTCAFGGACVDVNFGGGQGACFDTCSPQAMDCRNAYACLTVSASTSVCVADCTANADCAITNLCDAMTGFCEAPPPMTPTGLPCSGSYECLSNADDGYCITPAQGYPQGYCSELCDLANDDCAGDAICLDAGGGDGLCFDGCVTDADCPTPGYQCYPVGGGAGVCAPSPDPEADCSNFGDDDGDGLYDCQDPDCQAMPVCQPGMTATGLPCAASSDCAANMGDPFCIDEIGFGWPSGYCSEYCDLANDDCAGDAICVDAGLQNGSGICFDGCSVQANCPTPGYSCTNFDPMTKVCSANCTADAQCQAYCNPDDDLCYPETETCGDGQDNDFDNAIDCEDLTCAGGAGCLQQIGMACMGAAAGQAMNMGNTTGGSNVLSACSGSGAPERIYAYTAPQNGTLTVSLSSAADLGVYIRTNCTDKDSLIACLDSSPAGGTEQFSMPVQGGVPLAIIVDGAGPGDAGAFTLSLMFAP